MKVINKPAKVYSRIILNHNKFNVKQDFRNFLFGWAFYKNGLMICFMFWTIFIVREEKE